MPSTNLTLVRSIFADWERGDFSSADWAHPDIEFSSPHGVEAGSSFGLAGLADAWGATMSAWTDIRTQAVEYVELDEDRVLVPYTFSGRGKLSGMTIDAAWTRGAALFRIDAGKVTKLTIFVDRDQALAELELADAELGLADAET